MSHGDIRAYYAALAIELPAWSTREAPVRCFAAPDAHRHEDCNPSCSVNLDSGAFNCHGCGAKGGAYDAALARGHTPRSAIDLMIIHGLVERRPPSRSAHSRPMVTRQDPLPAPAAVRIEQRAAFTIAERDVLRWGQALSRRPALLASLQGDRGWAYAAIRELELGLDQLAQRITIPIRDHSGQLQGLLRYDPANNRHGPKMRAAPGTRLGLIPNPSREPSKRILLVEGPPDMIAARSHSLPAIAVPSATAWQHEWAQALAGRHVTVIMDADRAGRRAAEQIAADLRAVATVEVVDLAPDRDDGYDLTDRLRERPHEPLAGQPLTLARLANAHSHSCRPDVPTQARAI